ncbi:MAG: hypothetical protein JSS87_01125 [Acidobacteria bacterium]|nr:hypothetical protein [Acidobacteriota bacterium]
MAFAQTPANVSLPAGPLLPQTVGVWTRSGAFSGIDLGASRLKEYGLKRSDSATYNRTDGKDISLQVEVWDMQDATGAYSAFTLQRAGMHDCASTAKLGHDCALGAGHLLFWSGESLVDVNAHGSYPIRLPELQPFVDVLPKPPGTKGALPVLPLRLPKKELQRETIRYAVGPATYADLNVPVDASLVDFSKSPEIITAKYAGATRGLGSLTIIFYPTPQIAGDRERAIAAALKMSQPEVAVKRVATMVAIAGGAFTHAQAEVLVNQVTPHEDFTFNNPSGYVPPGESIQTTVSVLTRIIIFVIVMTLAAAVLGVFFGGGRALIRKLQGKPLSSLEDMEIIKLEIGGKPSHKLVSESQPEGTVKRIKGE